MTAQAPDAGIIQRARDVLAKWRDGTHEGPWNRLAPVLRDAHGRLVVSDPTSADARLIVGTAGNPELWDAIDEMLALAIEYGALPVGSESRFIERAQRIAAAIAAADERMSA